MSSLALYRSLITAHVAVADADVELWLGIAALRHTASAWGVMFPYAMVWWAAHTIELDPSITTVGSTSTTVVGPLVSQKDGDLQRTYADPSSSSGGVGSSSTDDDLATTRYGLRYLDIRDSRAAVQPGIILSGPL